jgi:DNA primase
LLTSFSAARTYASQAPDRIDTDLLRQQHPIVHLIGQYGIELRRSGSAFIGRCPFHPDGGRPNLTAYPYVIWNQG